ncbi:ABC transporter substrate-binding protein [Kribbella sp. NPDC059898]|uniref:ABC transporter substrate-binding protein n=1 Tax=Kribbella sp. NPDC059898 TaxID=3346995 RepID=UPI003652B33F
MRISRRSVVATAALTAAALLLSACGGSSAGSDTGSGTPQSGGTLTFYDPIQYVAWNATNSTWSNSNVTDNLVDRLIWQDPKTGDFKPWLATSWEISPDHLTYTFHLRQGVTFSNGDPLDAETVKLNFDQHGLGDKKLAIPPDSFWVNYKGTTAVDPQTVRVTLTKPNAGFLQVLSNYRASSILGKPYLKQDFNGQSKLENWVGTGPFVVEKVDGTTGVTLKRRDDYNWAPEGSGHQGKAYLEKIVFKTVPEAGTRVGALQSGEAQIARNIAPYDEQTVAAGGGKIDAIPVQGETNKLAFQLDANPLTQDKSIRLALQAATDRQEINKTVLSPSYPVPTSLLVKGTPLRGDSSKYLTYDLDKAKSLLDADGWTVGADGIRVKNGQRLHFDIWVSPYYQVSQSVLELLQSQWKKAGVELKINSASLTEYQALETARGAKWSFTQGQTSTGEPSVLRASYGSDRYNVLHSPKADVKLDGLLAAQAVQFDPAKRKAAIQEIEDYVLGQGYVIPLYDETQVFGLGPKIHGFATESTARSWLYDTWLSK